MSDKENVSGKRETETLILAKDSGKQFTSGGSSVHLRGGERRGCCPLLDKQRNATQRDFFTSSHVLLFCIHFTLQQRSFF